MSNGKCSVHFKIQGQGEATDISLMDEERVIELTLNANPELCKLHGYKEAVRKSVYEQWRAMGAA